MNFRTGLDESRGGNNMKRMKGLAWGALVACAIMLPVSIYAEEGGSGHYTPGATASFFDTLPGKPGLALANFFNYYDASAGITRQLPFAGSLTANIDATCYADILMAIYQTPLKLLGGSYAVATAIPYVWLEIKGNVSRGGRTISLRDSANGIGDIVVYPFMLGWVGLNGDLKYDARLGIYTPTGDYEKGKLANLGKNYWTFEPAVSLSYISSKIGLEVSAFAGMDFNTKNNETEYQTGSQFHLDFTVAEHLPLLGGVVGVGANGFYYQQITGDSGSGAKLGDFKGRTLGIGPVVSYMTKIWGKDLVAEAKWLPEIDVEKRLKGNYVWFKLGMLF